MRIARLKQGQCIYVGDLNVINPVLIGDNYGMFNVVGMTLQTKRKDPFIDKFIVIKNVHNDRYTVVSPKRLLVLKTMEYSVKYLRKAALKTNCKFTEVTAWKAYTEWYDNIECPEGTRNSMSYYAKRYNVSDITFKKLIDGVSYKGIIQGMLSGKLKKADLSVSKTTKSADVRLIESNNTIYALKDVAVTIVNDKGYDMPQEVINIKPHHAPPYHPDMLIENVLEYNQFQISALFEYLIVISRVGKGSERTSQKSISQQIPIRG